MLVCITSQGKAIDSEVSPVFGRCPYFIFVNTDTMEYEAIENANVDAPGGAGVQAAQFVISKNPDALITGNIGPHAYQTLSGSNLRIYKAQEGTVKENIEKLKRGKLTLCETHTTNSKSKH